MTTSAPNPRDELARRVRDVLRSHPSVREVRMFGGLAFMVEERMAVCALRDGSLLVRTDPARYDELLSHGGEPASMGTHRPMGRGWMSVPGPRLEGDEALGLWVSVGLRARPASS